MATKTGVCTLINKLIGASKAAVPYKEGGINTRFSSGAGAGCLEK